MLIDELDLWSQLETTALFWWRNDDVIYKCPELVNFLQVGAKWKAPIALSIIPVNATSCIGSLFDQGATLCGLQHGYKHIAHSFESGRPSEFGSGRDARLASLDIMYGFQRMIELIGSSFIPIFVPPWNTIDPRLSCSLQAAGIEAISGYSLYCEDISITNFPTVNIDIDLSAWRCDPPRFIGNWEAVVQLVCCLQYRHLGILQTEMPIGLLTHHMVDHVITLAFMQLLVQIIAEHPGSEWISVSAALNYRKKAMFGQSQKELHAPNSSFPQEAIT